MAALAGPAAGRGPGTADTRRCSAVTEVNRRSSPLSVPPIRRIDGRAEADMDIVGAPRPRYGKACWWQSWSGRTRAGYRQIHLTTGTRQAEAVALCLSAGSTALYDLPLPAKELGIIRSIEVSTDSVTSPYRPRRTSHRSCLGSRQGRRSSSSSCIPV